MHPPFQRKMPSTGANHRLETTFGSLFGLRGQTAKRLMHLLAPMPHMTSGFGAQLPIGWERNPSALR